MGLFSRRSRTNTDSSYASAYAASSTDIPSPSRSSRNTPLSSSPNPGASSPASSVVRFRVAVDPAPLKGNNKAAKELFYVEVSPDASVAALRREIARTVGHGSMALFKVSIPHHAHAQSRTYTERYGRSVDLLARFPAFNLDDPRQLGLSLDSRFKAMSEGVLASGDLKIKHWFPGQMDESSETIQIIARPLQGMPINHVPLTLRAYFANPQASSSAGPSSRTLPAPVVIDINPYITVDELKAELLRAAGREAKFWKSVTLWQIAMTEDEMNVIDGLGRLKKGKMPWPYPPGAMEPIAMTDGNLPVSLFFPKSAPNGDMLNLSVWLDPASGAYDTPSTSTLRDTASFRYPMAFDERPVHSHTLALPLASSSVVDLAVPHVHLQRRSGNRVRPSTAPEVLVSGSDVPKVRAFGAGSRPPANSTRSSPSRNRPIAAEPQPPVNAPKGLGIAADVPPLDRTSFSSMISSEDEGCVPSLNFSQHSLATPVTSTVMTPETEKQEWLCTPPAEGVQLKKTGSRALGNLGSFSLRDRIRKAAAGSPMM